MNRQQGAGLLGTRTGMSGSLESSEIKIANIASYKLNWSRSSFPDDFRAMQKSRQVDDLFDVIIASDCLFFREFHVDLVAVLVALLKPVSGIALFFQPKRDGTMDQFLALCEGIFSIEIQDNYYEPVRTTNTARFSLRLTYVDFSLRIFKTISHHEPVSLLFFVLLYFSYLELVITNFL